MITLIPNAGLCNRMRAVDSALALSSTCGHRLQVYWEKNVGLNCCFSDIFEPLPAETVTMYEVNRKPYRFYNPRNVRKKLVSLLLERYQNYYFDKTIYVEEVSAMLKEGYDFKRLGKYRSVLIESHSRFFYPTQMPLYRHFIPLSSIKKKIDEVSQSFSSATVGVHIRRGDNHKSIESSPYDLFVRVMKREIEVAPETNFFVASDDHKVKSDLTNLFGHRIILSTPQKGERDTKEGVINAVVDLYALSRTKKVLGSHWSSFSHTASHISGIEEIVVKEDLLPPIYRD